MASLDTEDSGLESFSGREKNFSSDMTDSSEPDCSVSDKDDQEFVPGTESESDSDTEVLYPRLEELQGIKKDMYRHDCVACPKEDCGPRRQLVKKGKLLMPGGYEKDSEALQLFWNSLTNDNVAVVAKNDSLIGIFGTSAIKTKRKGFDKDNFAQIRNSVRELSRLLIELRSMTKQPNAGLSEFIVPEHFQAVVGATKKVAGYCEATCSFKIPSLAQKLGHSLHKCADIMEAKAIENRDEVEEQNAKGYLKLHDKWWNPEVSAHADRTLYRQKKGRAKRIPLCKDVAALSEFLSKKSVEAIGNLETDSVERNHDVIVKKAWNNLAEVTLTQLILFNRRRQGEVSKLKLSDLTNPGSQDSDLLDTLSPLEKKLCDTLTRVEIFGKRGRIVPVLFTAKMKAAVDLLVTKREAAGISRFNEYVFACSHFLSECHLRGSCTLRKLVLEAKLTQPELITGTNLRKQVATLSQVVNLRDNELDVLAQFMGHNIRIHREFYRSPNDTVQLAKVSKLLLALEKGMIPQGKGLDDIQDHSFYSLELQGGTSKLLFLRVCSVFKVHICTQSFGSSWCVQHFTSSQQTPSNLERRKISDSGDLEYPDCKAQVDQ
ncbi:hypothetical protein BaRGS_00037430, partial [Batillaria attramentaria]